MLSQIQCKSVKMNWVWMWVLVHDSRSLTGLHWWWLDLRCTWSSQYNQIYSQWGSSVGYTRSESAAAVGRWCIWRYRSETGSTPLQTRMIPRSYTHTLYTHNWKKLWTADIWINTHRRLSVVKRKQCMKFWSTNGKWSSGPVFTKHFILPLRVLLNLHLHLCI